MSQASVLEFVEVAKVDDTLRSQLEATTNPAQLKEIAAQKGYDFTEEEMITAFQEQGLLVITEEKSLSESELEAVAGAGPGDRWSGELYGGSSYQFGSGFKSEIGFKVSFKLF